MLSLILSAALAQSYSVDFPVKASAPTELPSDHAITASLSFLGIAPGYADQTIASSWSYVKCAIDDESVVVQFTSTVASWPSSWPSSATCTGGGYSLTIHLKDDEAPGALDYDADFVPSAGIFLEAADDQYLSRTYNLPSGGSYTLGQWTGRLSPSVPWTGVECLVNTMDGDPKLQIVVRSDVAEGDGYCVIPHAGSNPPYVIAVDLDRI